MSLTDTILESVRSIATDVKKRSYKGYISGSAFFPVDLFGDVIEKLDNLADKVAQNGEKISFDLSQGTIVDSGTIQFEIKKGRGIELYDYDGTTATFIRLYHLISPDKEWAALYVDENPHTPWWSEDERSP